MYRMIPYRGFEIHVTLKSSAEDLYNVSFQIKSDHSLALGSDRSGRIPLRNGPFTRRWAYLIAEVAGQAAIDVLLGASAGDGSAARPDDHPAGTIQLAPFNSA